jgi:hypothetical protein
MNRTRRTLALSAALCTLAAGSAALAVREGWKPWQFGTNELYELRMIDHSSPDARPLGFELDIRPAEARDGAEQVTIRYTTEIVVPAAELGPETAFGGALGAGMGMGPAMLLMNPMITAFMGEMNLAVGEKMSLFGTGRIEITGKKEIAGLEGFVCKCFGPKEQNEPLQYEWVLHPDLALPLESITYDSEGKKTWEIRVERYEKR